MKYFCYQLQDDDCGFACLKMLLANINNDKNYLYLQNYKDNLSVDVSLKKMWTFGFVLLKYEYDRRFYLNFGKVENSWYSLKDIYGKYFWLIALATSLSIDFGLNIIGVNDWRKKRKGDIEI